MPHTATPSKSRLRVVASVSAPSGIVNRSPARLPAVMAKPMFSGVQPRLRRNTPRNGPNPSLTSARPKHSSERSGNERFSDSIMGIKLMPGAKHAFYERPFIRAYLFEIENCE